MDSYEVTYGPNQHSQGPKEFTNVAILRSNDITSRPNVVTWTSIDGLLGGPMRLPAGSMISLWDIRRSIDDTSRSFGELQK